MPNSENARVLIVVFLVIFSYLIVDQNMTMEHQERMACITNGSR